MQDERSWSSSAYRSADIDANDENNDTSDNDDFYFCDISSSSHNNDDAKSLNSDRLLDSLRQQVLSASAHDTPEDDVVSIPFSVGSNLSNVNTFTAVLPDHESLLNLQRGVKAYGSRRYCYYFWYACCAALWCTKDTETPHGAARHYRKVAVDMLSLNNSEEKLKRRRRVLCCGGHCYTPPHRSHDAWQIKSHAYTFISIVWSILCGLFYYALTIHHPWVVQDDIRTLLRNILLASLFSVSLLMWIALCVNAWWKSCQCRRYRLNDHEEHRDGHIDSYGDNWILHDDDDDDDDDDYETNDIIDDQSSAHSFIDNSLDRLVQQSSSDGHFRPVVSEANVGKKSLIADNDVSLVNHTLLELSSPSLLKTTHVLSEQPNSSSTGLLDGNDNGYTFHRQSSSVSTQQWSALMYQDRARRRASQRRMARADRASVWCCCRHDHQ